MTTYLKLDTALPAGPQYLNVNDITLPSAILELGGMTNAFNFMISPDDLVGSSTTIGTPLAVADGYRLGGGKYINTGIKESTAFTWIALYKVETNNAAYNYAPVISSWVHESVSTTGLSKGTLLGMLKNAYKVSDTAATSLFNLNGTPSDKWVLAIISKKVEADGTHKHHYGVKVAGSSKQLNSSTAFGTSVPNTENNVCVGYGEKGGSLLGTSDKIMNLASIHNIGLDQTQVSNLIDALIPQIALKGIIL